MADKLRSGKGIRGTALLMRHGETAWNRVGRVMGHNPIELDEAGRAQVELAVPAARAIKPDLIISSPLPRAKQSAEIIAKGIGGMTVARIPTSRKCATGDGKGWCSRTSSTIPSMCAIASIR